MTCSPRLVVAGLLAALTSCSEAPVRRVVPLAPEEDGLPTAFTSSVGTALRLDLDGLEPLAHGRRLYAWALTAGAWSPLAEVSLGSNRLTGPSWEAVDELLVTDEGEALGPQPTPLVMFRGPLGGKLPFEGPAGPTLHELEEARVELVLEDLTLTAHVEALPSLVAGAYWGVWLLGAPVPDEEQEATFLGRLEGDDSRLVGDELLADHHEALLTLELENGLESRGPAVMRGQVLNPAARAAPAQAHSPH